MCGIAGIVNHGDAAERVDTEALARMTTRMRARGPDGEGLWQSPDGRVALGHRRLSIIDLSSAGAQPMVDPATSNVIVFNGEIYNYRELKRELEAAGQRFRSGSDTEVLLHLYTRHGEVMVERLRGMFAFALWDARQRRLVLARDPHGIKPLYYTDDGRTLRFASQVKALLAGGGISDAPSPAGMAGFFLWGHVPEPWTWVDAIKALPAGCTLTIEHGKPAAAPRRYFDLREAILAAEQSAPLACDVIEEVLGAVEDSIRHHQVADVPIGAFLSAGRDSTLIATLAAHQSSAPLRTLTLGFDEYRGTPNDEVPVAERVAELLGVRHETCRIRREDFEAARQSIVEAMDQPSIDGVNTWFVARAAAQTGLKVALSGLGGDELFGGYPSFQQVPRVARRMRLLAAMPWVGRAFRFALAPVIRHVANPKWAGLAEYGGTLHGAWLLRRALFMPWELQNLMPVELAREGLAALGVKTDLRARIQGIRNPQLAVMALEMGGYMRNQLLRDADWAGMAHSLEIRVPLVDATLLRRWLPLAAHRFPLSRQRLIEAADERVAAVVDVRPKSGFSVPVAQWLGASSARPPEDGGLRPWAKTILSEFLAAGFLGEHEHIREPVQAVAQIIGSGPGASSPLKKRRLKILIFRYGQLGDTLIALPAIRVVRQQYPDAEITLLCDKHASTNWVLAKEVFPPALVDQVMTYEADSSAISLGSAIRLCFRLRAGRFDKLIYLAPRQRGFFSILRDMIFFKISGIKEVAGHRRIVPLTAHVRRTHPLPLVEHEAENLLSRLRVCGIGHGHVKPDFGLALTDKERSEAELWLRAHHRSPPDQPLVAVCAGSKWPSKRWPEDRFMELGKRLVQEFSLTPVIVGGAEDRALGNRLIAAWGKGLNAAGELSVRGSAALIERCGMYVGNDTGVMHLAAAVGVPCVAIFAAQDWPGRWHPYGTCHVVLRRHPPCEGCKLVQCVEHSMRCLMEISVDTVLDACRTLIEGGQTQASAKVKVNRRHAQ
jgi:asparagine synthase (glutamine-hydrolysing)